MFVPRSLRLKGVKEPPKKEPEQRGEASTSSNANVETPNVATQINSTFLQPGDQTKGPENTTKGPKFTIPLATPEYLAQLAAGVELIFTDYAHQHPEHANWLRERYRTVEGEENFLHLSAILEHGNILALKPEATQILLRQAIQENNTGNLELSKNGFYVRRVPASYPLPFIPLDSFNIMDEDGMAFWDQRTIYVEPHIRHLSKTPAKVAQWLQEHGQLRKKWLPIQAVETIFNSCAFVVLSGNVMHEDVWAKWRSTEKPEDWKIMTKAEHTKRTKEYLELLDENRASLKRKHSNTNWIEDGDLSNADNVRDDSADNAKPKEDSASDTGEQAASRASEKRRCERKPSLTYRGR